MDSDYFQIIWIGFGLFPNNPNPIQIISSGASCNIEHELLKPCTFSVFTDHPDRSHATSIRKQSLQDRISIFAKACLVGFPVPNQNGIVYACRKRAWVCLPNPPNGTLDTKGLFWVQLTRRMKWIPMDRYAPSQGLGTCCLEMVRLQPLRLHGLLFYVSTVFMFHSLTCLFTCLRQVHRRCHVAERQLVWSTICRSFFKVSGLGQGTFHGGNSRDHCVRLWERKKNDFGIFRPPSIFRKNVQPKKKSKDASLRWPLTSQRITQWLRLNFQGASVRIGHIASGCSTLPDVVEPPAVTARHHGKRDVTGEAPVNPKGAKNVDVFFLSLIYMPTSWRYPMISPWGKIWYHQVENDHPTSTAT